jgi:hypothetical protein
MEAPLYRYGGISEFDLIYQQLLADGLVQEASPRILQKASTMFYKVAGFHDAVSSGQEAQMVEYFQRLESVRGIMAAGIVDKEDDLEVVAQSISNLADADQITLRRLAMVTGISVTRLIGEAPRGMNSTGEKEAQMDQDMLDTLRSDYLIEPLNLLMHRLGAGCVEFKKDEGQTALQRLDYDTKVIDNALRLYELGEDYGSYLKDKGVVQVDAVDDLFGELFPEEKAGDLGNDGNTGDDSPRETTVAVTGESPDA